MNYGNNLLGTDKYLIPNLHFFPNFFCIGLNVHLLQTKFLGTVFKISHISSEVIAALRVCAQ